MNRQKLMEDYKATLDNLQGNIELFNKGNKAAYRVVAVQLHLLLCGKNPIVSRVFTSSALHPLRGSMNKEIAKDLIFHSPALIEFDGQGNSKIISLFDENKAPLSLTEWLEQPLLNNTITIRQLIASIRDKEAAHVDLEYDKTLSFTKTIKLPDDDLQDKYIIAIGEYVLKSLRSINDHFEIN